MEVVKEGGEWYKREIEEHRLGEMESDGGQMMGFRKR